MGRSVGVTTVSTCFDDDDFKCAQRRRGGRGKYDVQSGSVRWESFRVGIPGVVGVLGVSGAGVVEIKRGAAACDGGACRAWIRVCGGWGGRGGCGRGC